MEPEQERLQQEKKKKKEGKDVIIKFAADLELEKSGFKQI